MINLNARIENLNLYINIEIQAGHLLEYFLRQEIVLYKGLGENDVVAYSLKKQKVSVPKGEDPSRMFGLSELCIVKDFLSHIDRAIRKSFGSKAFYVTTSMDDIITNDTHLLMESVLFTAEGNIKINTYYRQDEDCKSDEYKYYLVITA